MKITDAVLIAKESVEKLEYQPIKDSPTIPYYTNWELYDRFHGKAEYAPKCGLCECYDIDLWRDSVRDPILITDNEEVSLFNPNESKILALNFANLVLSKKLYLPRGTIMEKPLVIGVEYHGDKNIEGHHITIQVDTNVLGRIVLVERAVGNSLPTTTIEVIMSKNSHLHFEHIYVGNEKTPSFNVIRILQEDNTHLSFKGLYLGGEMHRQQVEASLVGNNSHASMRIGAYGRPNTKVDIVTNARIIGINDEFIYNSIGFTEDYSYVSLRANALIEEGSKRANADINGLIYNLGKNTTAIASPMLYIKTNNVRGARHSKAIITLTDELKFYMASRGLSIDDFKKLLRSELLEGIISLDKNCIKRIYATN